MLELRSVRVRYGELTIVDDVSFSLAPGSWLMIVGPNGAGKSTLANAIAGGVKYSGSILWQGRPMSSLSPAARARCLGLLSQSHYVGYGFTVEEVVRLGRYAHSKDSPAARDAALVESALELTGLMSQRRQSVLTLSGGELQRTFLAQLFAQDPELLILDEPSNHLDLVYQKQVFSLIQDWIARTGKTVISVVHDLSLARAFGGQALLMDKGKALAFGPTETVLCPQRLDPVYSMDVSAWMRMLLKQWEE